MVVITTEFRSDLQRSFVQRDPPPPSCSEQSHIRLNIIAAISQTQVRVKRRAGRIALSIAPGGTRVKRKLDLK